MKSVYLPSVYLNQVNTCQDIPPKKSTIASDESLEVQLNISAPKTPIGGYYFDLIF